MTKLFKYGRIKLSKEFDENKIKLEEQIMKREDFDNEVFYTIEVEYEIGGRGRLEVKGKELDATFESIADDGDYISDCEYSTNQPNAWVRKVLNLAFYNLKNNLKWCLENDCCGLESLIDYIIENDLA